MLRNILLIIFLSIIARIASLSPSFFSSLLINIKIHYNTVCCNITEKLSNALAFRPHLPNTIETSPQNTLNPPKSSVLTHKNLSFPSSSHTYKECGAIFTPCCMDSYTECFKKCVFIFYYITYNIIQNKYTRSSRYSTVCT